jgi:steroid 5-alpha reductase family enzyme
MNAPDRMAGGPVRGLLDAVGAVLAVGAACSVAGVPDLHAAALLTALAVTWGAVLVVARERRIRARLADPRTHPGSTRPGVVAAPTIRSGVA